MINTVIVDDELHCINSLTQLLATGFGNEINITGVFSSFQDGLDGIRKLTPDLVFLDVQLGDNHTGFDLLMQFNQIDFGIIFTTAFEKYAVQAFRISAIDFLLKPVDANDLNEAIQKFTQKRTDRQLATGLEVLFHNLTSNKPASKRLCVPVVNGLEVLQIEDIVRCESTINYTTLYLKDRRKLTVAKTLKEFEEILSAYDFFRVHNSHLINLSYVKSYNKGKGGFVVLNDESSVEVSSRRKEEFLKRLTNR